MKNSSLREEVGRRTETGNEREMENERGRSAEASEEEKEGWGERTDCTARKNAYDRKEEKRTALP